MSLINCISVEEAETLLDTHSNTLLLDCRDARAYCTGHHPHAIHLNDFNLRTFLKHTPKDIQLVIYCYHGNNSQDFAKLFADFGFQHCHSVDGGFDAWRHVLFNEQPVRYRVNTQVA
jgi:rhodanese-related sulfurtransferase